MAATAAGVSYSDFLSMTPAQLQAVRDGYLRRSNYEAWLCGLYTQAAISSVVSAAFSKKGNKPFQYPAQPYRQLQQPQTEEEKQKEIENERLKAIAYMNMFVRAGKHWGK